MNNKELNINTMADWQLFRDSGLAFYLWNVSSHIFRWTDFNCKVIKQFQREAICFCRRQPQKDKSVVFCRYVVSMTETMVSDDCLKTCHMTLGWKKKKVTNQKQVQCEDLFESARIYFQDSFKYDSPCISLIWAFSYA